MPSSFVRRMRTTQILDSSRGVSTRSRQAYNELPMNTEPLLLTRRQVRLVDELAVSELKMPSIVLMENAGRGAADIIAKRTPDAGRVAVFCGAGNNGGDGFVIARHLHNAGRRVR